MFEKCQTAKFHWLPLIAKCLSRQSFLKHQILDAYGHFSEYQLDTLKALCILVIIGNIPLIVCHLFYVVGRYYIIPDIRNPSTLILSSEIMYRYVLLQMRCSVTEHSSTAQHGEGEGVFYFKLMNKTSWQEHFWQTSGALVAALCRHSNWFGFTIKITVVLCSSYLPRPNPEGTSEVWVLTMCVFVCMYVWNVNVSQS